MLIDINSYVGNWPFKELKYNTCTQLGERMDKFGVDVSVISNLNGIFYKNTQAANIELYDQIRSDRKYADRFIPFAIINPVYAGWRDDLKTCAKKYKMRGVRLYPKYHGYELLNPSLVELVKTARDLNLTVAFTLRMVDKRQRSWMDLDSEWALKDVIPIIKEVPDAKYFILNVANSTRLTDEDAEVIRNAKIVMDTSGRALANLNELIEIFGKDKFAFGTHSPILDYLSGLLRIEVLEADDIDKELLKSKNAKTLLEV